MVINYRNVNIGHQQHVVLTNVNLQAQEGDFIFVTGKVGTGKTSLLRTLYAMLPVKGSEAQVLEFDLLRLKRKRVPELRKKLGIVFQDFQLLPDRTAYDNLEFVLRATNWKKKSDIAQRIQEVLSQVGLEDKQHHFPHELSGGEQQRLSIARAMLNTPQLIIADEPTGNLDFETSKHIVQILKECSQAGATVIMSTHNEHLIPLVEGCRILHCEDGKLQEASASEAPAAQTTENQL